MKRILIILLCLITYDKVGAQKNKVDKFSPTYTSCEVKHCYGQRIISLSDTTKLLLKTCSDGVGCTTFKNAGKWTNTMTGVIIQSRPKFKVLSDLNGQFYNIKKEDYEILIHGSIVGDSTKIISEIESGFKSSREYNDLLSVTSSLDKKYHNKILRKRVMSSYIKQQMTWKYKILVRDW